MTAVSRWDTAGPTDAELARAAAAGDRSAFAGIYDRYADRLYDFCVGMLRDRHAAADCVQDAFCNAAARLSQLREPDKLRPWLYSIARNEALRHIRNRGRERVADEVPEAISRDAGPDTLAGRNELANLIAEAAGGLSDRDRNVLDLAYRHGLEGAELADALGVSQNNANVMVHRLRDTIERALGALLVSRRAQSNPGRCPQLSAILDGWDGQFTVLMRKRIARHIESCPTCEQDRRRLVSPAALLGAAPLLIPAPAWLREHTLDRIQLDSASTPLGDEAGGQDAARQRADAASPDQPGHASTALADGDQTPKPGDVTGTPVDSDATARRRADGRLLVLMTLVIGVPLVCLGVTIGFVYGRNASVTPAGVTTAPPPAGVTGTLPPPAGRAPAGPSGGAASNGAPLPPPVGTNTTAPAVTVPASRNPAVIPTAPANPQCPGGTVPADGSCPTPVPVTQCPGGGSVPVGQTCPTPVPVTQCPGGSTVPVGQSCPRVFRCRSGAIVTPPQACPSGYWRRSPSRSLSEL